ncbi:MAG TPA: hypothetical protein VEV43_14165 [Actinomycetota bacterium]|nr:hypothetical protein [Actinomycetota bacterium]
MKKIVAGVALAAALLVPATAAQAASEPGPPAGVRPCGPMQIGVVVWVANPKTGETEDVAEYCEPIGP